MTVAVLSLAVFLSFAYPRKYRREIAEACREFDLEETLVCAVIHTESKFEPSACSRVGAMGLMQLMPATAVWIADSIGAPELAGDLYAPAANIRLGAAYLRYLLDKFPLRDALAAYNAGEGNVLRWQAEGRETYGYKETRDYVKKVLRARTIYKKFR